MNAGKIWVGGGLAVKTQIPPTATEKQGLTSTSTIRCGIRRHQEGNSNGPRGT